MLQQLFPLRRALRLLSQARSPLGRGSDRVQAWSCLAALTMVLLAVPIALSLAGLVGADLSDVRQEQVDSRRQVGAVLLEDAAAEQVGTSQQDTVSTTATWSGPWGTSQRGTVPAPRDARVGDEVQIWVDGEGALTTRPLSQADIDSTSSAIGILSYLGLVGSAAGGHWVVCRLIWRRRSRDWDQRWASVEPIWAGRADR